MPPAECPDTHSSSIPMPSHLSFLACQYPLSLHHVKTEEMQDGQASNRELNVLVILKDIILLQLNYNIKCTPRMMSIS